MAPGDRAWIVPVIPVRADRRLSIERGKPRTARYRVVYGPHRIELTATEARTDWDRWPTRLRSGVRDGAFILWSVNELGCRTAPMIYRPIQ